MAEVNKAWTEERAAHAEALAHMAEQLQRQQAKSEPQRSVVREVLTEEALRSVAQDVYLQVCEATNEECPSDAEGVQRLVRSVLKRVTTERAALINATE